MPELADALTAGPCGDLTYIVGKEGRPLTKSGFSNNFKAACKAAGVAGRIHGLRKTATMRLIAGGASDADIQAIMGWTSSRMVKVYGGEFNREVGAERIGHLLSRPAAGGTLP